MKPRQYTEQNEALDDKQAEDKEGEQLQTVGWERKHFRNKLRKMISRFSGTSDIFQF